MIVQGRWRAIEYTLSLKDASLSVAINRDEIAACDRAGRMYSLYHAGYHYRRSLSGHLLQKHTTAAGRQRQWLAATAADQLIDFAAGQWQQLYTALQAPDWKWIAPPDRFTALNDLLNVIEQAARFDSAAARSDAARFAEIYSTNGARDPSGSSIGILPPDQYLALVLQATEGCSFNTCTFCDLYHQPFRIKTPVEFRQHIARVREYMGESILLRRRSIFLGAANALAIPRSRLLPLFEIMAEEFPTTGVYAFLDAFTGTRKSVKDYGALAQSGLKRVYIGLESGHDPLLAFVRKPGRAHDAIETVRAIKAAGIHVGIIVLIGLGGDRYAAGHVAGTLQVLNDLQLGAGDLLYFSDLVEEPGTPYPRLAAQQGIRPLNAEERSTQRAAIRAGLHADGAKISNYDVREFVY